MDFTDDEERALSEELKRLLEDALRRAEESPLPEPAELLVGVFEPFA